METGVGHVGARGDAGPGDRSAYPTRGNRPTIHSLEPIDLFDLSLALDLGGIVA